MLVGHWPLNGNTDDVSGYNNIGITPNKLAYSWYTTTNWYNANLHPTTTAGLDAFFNTANSGIVLGGTGFHNTTINWSTTIGSKPTYLPADFYSWMVEGLIYCPIDGTYTFKVNSDDAADVFVNNTLVSQYYGGHGMSDAAINTPIFLNKGFYQFRARFEEGGGGDGIEVTWIRPGDLGFSVIPADSFFKFDYTSGKIGQAGSFNGTNSLITTNLTQASLQQEFTISAWVYALSGANYKGVLGDHLNFTGINFCQYQDGTAYFTYGNGSAWVTIANISLPLNTWHHVTMVLKTGTGGYGKVYLNGIQQGSTLNNPSSFSPRNSILIGRAFNNSDRYWSGQINDVRVYNHALSEYEVKEIAKARILHYTFNDENEEPTINVVTNTNLNTGWSTGYQTAIVFNEIAPPPGISSQTVGHNRGSSAGYWYSYGDFAPQVPNVTYTVSLYVKTLDSNFNISFYTADNSEAGRYWSEFINVPNNGDWHRIVWLPFTNASNSQSNSLSFNFTYAGAIGAANTRTWFSAPQMEAKSHATPFVEGIRNIGVRDSSGYINNGTFSAIATSPRYITDSKLGSRSLYFNGTDPHIITGLSAFSGLTTVTISFWRKNDTTITNWLPFVGQTTSFYIMATGSGTGGFYHQNIGSLWEIFKDGVGQGVGVAATPFTDQNWHHYAIRGVNLSTWTQLRLNGYTGVWNIEGYIDDLTIYNNNLSNSDILSLYNRRANFDNLGNVSSSEFVEKINYLDPAVFTQYSNNSKDPGYQVVDGRDTWRVFPAWYHPNGSQDGRFKANTQYEYNIWIKHSSYWTGGPYYVPGGFRVRYTDGTFTDITSPGATQDWVNLIGITVANKTIDDLYVYYFVSYEVKVDINSYFVEAGTISINNQGIADYVSFNEVDGTENTNAQQEIKQYNKNLLINGEFSEVD